MRTKRERKSRNREGREGGGGRNVVSRLYAP